MGLTLRLDDTPHLSRQATSFQATHVYDPPPADGAAVTLMTKPCDPVNELASVTVAVKLNDPVAVGVPLISPLELMPSPLGNAPAVTVKA
jgi:hypothetical protein